MSTGAEGLSPTSRSRWLVLGVLCVAVFTTMVDTSIVNVALPTMVRELHASTRDLLWVVDSYNLVFGALVLVCGSLSDRFGRKRALIIGLTVFGGASALGSLAESSAQLIAARSIMGVGAALVFPATLSIITNVFTDRTERATAIGAWGATAGLAVAVGPITGGALLGGFWWGSIFLALVPVALVATVLVVILVPESMDSSVPPLDLRGFLLSIVGLGTLVYTIIEAPGQGWLTLRTLGGFSLAAIALVVFVVAERRTVSPMLDVSLFSNLRFSAASGAVAVAFFALFGFLFLATQYFQFAKGYSALATGVRMLPVAISVGVMALVGTELALRLGNRLVVSSGLGIMSVAFLWFSTDTESTSYLVIAGQLVVAGIGIGLTSAPATEAIMDVVPADQAGIGSAVNDATREIGGTLGVAVLGSLFTSFYVRAFDQLGSTASLPVRAVATARGSLGAAEEIAAQLRGTNSAGARALLETATEGFFDGFAVGSLVAAAVTAVGCVAAACLLPGPPAVIDLTVDGDADFRPAATRDAPGLALDDLLPVSR